MCCSPMTCWPSGHRLREVDDLPFGLSLSKPSPHPIARAVLLPRALRARHGHHRGRMACGAAPRRWCTPVQRGRRRSLLARLRLRLNAMLSALGSENLGMELARANWPITVPEYVLLRFGLIHLLSQSMDLRVRALKPRPAWPFILATTTGSAADRFDFISKGADHAPLLPYSSCLQDHERPGRQSRACGRSEWYGVRNRQDNCACIAPAHAHGE